MPMAVNQAEIIISLYDTSSTLPLMPAEEYDLYVKDENGNYTLIFDNYLGADYFGGVLKDGEITFNVATHLQDYLAGSTDENEFHLFWFTCIQVCSFETTVRSMRSAFTPSLQLIVAWLFFSLSRNCVDSEKD